MLKALSVKMKHNENNLDFLTCEVEVVEDKNISKDLELLASGLIKKFERLQVLNKKEALWEVGNFSIFKISPDLTLYCFPPVCIIAYDIVFIVKIC